MTQLWDDWFERTFMTREIVDPLPEALLPPLFEHDDWLFVAQCLLWLADRDEHGPDTRIRKLGNHIMKLSRSEPCQIPDRKETKWAKVILDGFDETAHLDELRNQRISIARFLGEPLKAPTT
jgi:hypothetical protein